jgi:hypothetical protein
MFLKKRLSGLMRRLLVAAVLIVAAAAFVFAIRSAGGSASEQGLAIAERSVRRAAVQCYALEGSYPPSYDYLREHYGVRVDDGLYFVDYVFIAGNLMPDVTVLPAMDGLNLGGEAAS